MFVRDFMTRKPITISPEAAFPEAISLLRTHKIRRLPVLEDHKLVGIVVEEDLLSNQPSPATSLSVHELYYLLERLQVRQIMTHPVYTVGGECPLEDAARIMVEKKISCLPVMEDSLLVGIITETDIFKTLVEILGGEEQGTRLTLRLTERVGELARITARIAEAGGNIRAVTSSRLLGRSSREVVIKEAGADVEKLRALIHGGEIEVLDIRSSKRYQPKVFG